MTEARKKKRGPKPVASDKKRGRCISVRVNDAELAAIDQRRGRQRRGAWLRQAGLDPDLAQTPTQIPEINLLTYAELGRIGTNLNQIAKRINSGINDEIPVLVQEISALRLALIGAQDEGNE